MTDGKENKNNLFDDEKSEEALKFLFPNLNEAAIREIRNCKDLTSAELFMSVLLADEISEVLKKNKEE